MEIPQSVVNHPNKPWSLEDAEVWKGALASLMLMSFRDGMLHADRGWLDTNKSEGMVLYRENTDELSTLQGFLKAMEENAKMGNPKVFERSFEAAIRLAKERIDKEYAVKFQDSLTKEEKEL